MTIFSDNRLPDDDSVENVDGERFQYDSSDDRTMSTARTMSTISTVTTNWPTTTFEEDVNRYNYAASRDIDASKSTLRKRSPPIQNAPRERRAAHAYTDNIVSDAQNAGKLIIAISNDNLFPVPVWYR